MVFTTFGYMGVENSAVPTAEAATVMPECNCGNTNDDLTGHADGCALKGACKLICVQSAKGIYANWEQYPENAQEFILTYLSWTNQTKLEELKKLIEEGTSADETQDKETSVSGTTITTRGNIPSNVTLSAEKVAEKNYNEEIYDITTEDKVKFAFNLTLTNKDGSEWQPGNGETVSVTLDAASLGLSDGTEIGIIHDDEKGTVERLGGTYTVTDGKLTFETNGFSVFYGYTVDFEYNGKTFQMPGGGYVYLTEVFEALEIDKNVNDVKNVEFTDEDLVELVYLSYTEEEGGGQDWRLVSHEPFESEETLTIIFNDGEVIVIDVTDAAWGTANIGENETWNDGDTNGNRNVTVNSTITVAENATVTLNGKITIPKNKTLTIVCKGNATLKRGPENNGADASLFHVNGGKLIIKSENGTVTIDGSSIEVARSAFVVGASSAENNDNDGSVLELTNVKIQNCYSNGSDYAGAIHLASAGEYRPIHDLVMDNCVIDNCRAHHGSAIYYRGNSMGKTEVTDTIIQNCIAYGKDPVDTNNHDDQGGTIRSNGQNGSFAVFERCIIKNNRSGYENLNTIRADACCYGGGIYWNAAGTLSSSYRDTIDANNDRAKMYLYDCQIIGNKASNRGGGIFNESAMFIGTKYAENLDNFVKTEVANTEEIVGTLIARNEATGYTGSDGMNCGGGIMVPTYGGGATEHNEEGATLKLGTGVFVIGNKSDHGAGISMVIRQAGSTVESGHFTINFDGAVVEDNEAAVNGGGIHIIKAEDNLTTELKLISGLIKNNKASSGNGGGIYVENTEISVGSDKAEDVAKNPIEIIDNEAAINGGGIYMDSGNMTVTNGTINTNKAFNGAGVYANSGSIEVVGGEITNNAASADGAGIYSASAAAVTVAGGKVNSNSAGAGGGGVYVNGGSMEITNGTVNNNSAVNGGGIYAINGGTVIMNGEGQVVGNSAIGHEGTGTAFTANMSQISGVGGGIFLANGVSETNMSSFTLNRDGKAGIYSNTATYAADDVYANGNHTDLDVPDVAQMDLAGLNIKPSGWYEDYVKQDSEYTNAKALAGNKKIGGIRYKSAGVNVTKVNIEKANNVDTYVCMTLGVGYGDLTIKKTGNNIDQEQIFVFHIDGRTASGTSINMDVTVKGSDTVTVYNLPYGEYEVTEGDGWSWRYVLDAIEGVAGDITVINERATVSIGNGSDKPVLEVTNKKETNKWLTDSFDITNIYGKAN